MSYYFKVEFKSWWFTLRSNRLHFEINSSVTDS